MACPQRRTMRCTAASSIVSRRFNIPVPSGQIRYELYLGDPRGVIQAEAGVTGMATTIVVAGATGFLGGRIVNALIERGADVRALVRDSAGTDKLETLASE